MTHAKEFVARRVGWVHHNSGEHYVCSLGSGEADHRVDTRSRQDGRVGYLLGSYGTSHGTSRGTCAILQDVQ